MLEVHVPVRVWRFKSLDRTSLEFQHPHYDGRTLCLPPGPEACGPRYLLAYRANFCKKPCRRSKNALSSSQRLMAVTAVPVWPMIRKASGLDLASKLRKKSIALRGRLDFL